jgi:MarR family transcriptional regulator for hemolysin
MSALEDRFSQALHSTSRAWRLALDRRLKGLGVSQASWLTIAVIARAGAPLSQTELAQRLAVEGATMVAMIDRLSEAGLVIRDPSTTDRRVKLVSLTNAGNQLYGKVRAEAEAFSKELLRSIDRHTLTMVTDLLEQLQTAAESAT